MSCLLSPCRVRLSLPAAPHKGFSLRRPTPLDLPLHGGHRNVVSSSTKSFCPLSPDPTSHQIDFLHKIVFGIGEILEKKKATVLCFLAKIWGRSASAVYYTFVLTLCLVGKSSKATRCPWCASALGTSEWTSEISFRKLIVHFCTH